MNIANKKLFPVIIVAFAAFSVLTGIAIWMLGGRFSIAPTVSSAVSTHSTVSTNVYTNTEYGFEFQYPENWTFHTNTFYSPFSKFNLVGASPEENDSPNPIASPLLINIVMPDFAERAVVNRKNLEAIETDIVVGGVNGKKYEYTENVAKISIDLPFREFRMILGANKKYEDVFNRILASFKFLK